MRTVTRALADVILGVHHVANAIVLVAKRALYHKRAAASGASGAPTHRDGASTQQHTRLLKLRSDARL